MNLLILSEPRGLANAVDLSGVHFRRSSADPLAFCLPAYLRLCRSWIPGTVVFAPSNLLKQLREQIQRPLRSIGYQSRDILG